MKHQQTEREQENQKYLNFLYHGNAMVVGKAIVFFDSEFLPSYKQDDQESRDLRHLWMCAFKTALLRDTPTLEQKILLLERYVCNADEKCVLPVVIVYLQRCAPGQQKPVEIMLRNKAQWVLDSPMVRELFPYALVG